MEDTKPPADGSLADTVRRGSLPASGGVRAGTTVGRFFMISELGAGGMGVVWAAYDPQLDRRVALKFVRAGTDGSLGQETLARLMREAQALARVTHPNVIAVHDVGADANQIYIAEELVPGVNLAQWLAGKPREVKEVLEVYLQAGRGLAAAHAAGIVHRDFKPANALVGEDGRVRVVDFGLARSTVEAAAPSPAQGEAGAPRRSAPLSSTLTQTGTVLGTPLYMSPEQHLGRPSDARTDQFSFCVSLYEALYGEAPFAGESQAELAGEVARGNVRAAPKASRVPGWLREVVLRGLRPEAGERWASMEALLGALARDPRAARQRIVAVLVVTAVVAASIVLGAQQVQQRRQLCRGAERKLGGVWDEARKSTAKAAFLATGAPNAPHAWTSVQDGLDAYSRDWAAMYTEACEATRLRGEQSDEVLDLRVTCLSERLQEIGAAAELLATADARVAQRAVQVVSGLSPLAGCGDVEALKAPMHPPRDAAAKAKAFEVRGRIARARALEDGDRYPEGLSEAEHALADARATGYGALEAEALLQLGRLQAAARQDEPAARTLEDAFLAAEACRHYEVAARSAVQLVAQVGANLARPADGQRWARIARAIVSRAGSAVEQGRLERNLGRVLCAQGKCDEGLASLRRAHAILEKTLGPESLEVAGVLDEVSAALTGQGRHEAAKDARQRALAIRQKALGPAPPETVGRAK